MTYHSVKISIINVQIIVQISGCGVKSINNISLLIIKKRYNKVPFIAKQELICNQGSTISARTNTNYLSIKLCGDVPRSPFYGVYIPQLIRFARVCSNVDKFNNRKLILTAKLLKQGYRYHTIRKAFSKFCHRHSELVVKYNMGLKTLLQKGISKPIFHGDLVYKFKRMVRKPNFSDQLKKIVKRYIRVGCHARVYMPGLRPNHGL